MKTQHLKREFRERLRELTLGFVEHCEFSHSLIGQIEHFIHYEGRKYGMPAFTFYGRQQPGLETRFVGLLGLNKPGEKMPAEVLLQLIERLVIQPQIASGSLLRIMPVSNPIALELGAEAPALEELPALWQQIDNFVSSALDGLICIGTSESPHLQVEAIGPGSVREAAQRAGSTMEQLASEQSEAGPICELRLRTEAPGAWRIMLDVPRAWPDTLAVHWVSQFLVVFFRAHTDALLRQSLSEAMWIE